MAELVGRYLRIDFESHIRLECVRRITWKLTKPSPFAFNRGPRLRCQQFSRENGVVSFGSTLGQMFFHLRRNSILTCAYVKHGKVRDCP